jgi:RNA polymerase sigma factor (TIGR02999 family)
MPPGPADEGGWQPASEDAESVTALLNAVTGGDRSRLDALFTRVYDELHGLAGHVRRGRAGETLDTTALVHEAYVKLVPSADRTWEGRAHFFGVAARAMRQVLVDAARRRMAAKRGAGRDVTLAEELHPGPVQPDALIALDEALDRLGGIDARAARVVEHRFFAGLTTAETARVLEISTATVERDWRAARAWLAGELDAGGS